MTDGQSGYSRNQIDKTLKSCSKSYVFTFISGNYTHIKVNQNSPYGTTELKIISRNSYAFSLFISNGDSNNVDGIKGKLWAGNGQSVKYKINKNYMDLYISTPFYNINLSVINLNESNFSLEYVETVKIPPEDTDTLSLS